MNSARFYNYITYASPLLVCLPSVSEMNGVYQSKKGLTGPYIFINIMNMILYEYCNLQQPRNFSSTGHRPPLKTKYPKKDL